MRTHLSPTARCTLLAMGLLLVVRPSFARPPAPEGVWHPGPAGTYLTNHVRNVDTNHTTAYWMDNAAFGLMVDDDATYDTWRTVDEAPQVRFELRNSGLDISAIDFVMTTRVDVMGGYGDSFQAGLFITLGSHTNRFYWGPHGGTSLRFRRPNGVNITVPYTNTHVYLKLKHKDLPSFSHSYAAWYSADGLFWSKAGEETIDHIAMPIHAGVMLKTWGTPHAESVVFQYFDITHVRDDPTPLTSNTPYGRFNATAPRFVYNLAGTEILMRLFKRQALGNAMTAGNIKFYIIHGSGTDNLTQEYEASLNFDRFYNDLTAGPGTNNYEGLNMVVMAPRFLRSNHPYPGRSRFWYQALQGEEDRILIDIHEDYMREKFPASAFPASLGADDRFYLVGHSGGGQYVSRFAMAHGAKLFRAVASSPASTAFPTGEYYWPLGLLYSSQFRTDNPRFAQDLSAFRELPLAVVMGETDNLVNRGEPDKKYEVMILGHSRHDNARKWHRQMDLACGGVPNLKTYLVPETGHSFSEPKRHVALDFLFGTAVDRAENEHVAYTYNLNSEDVSVAVDADTVNSGVLEYFNFARFDRPPCMTTQRCEFVFNMMQCRIYDQSGHFVTNVPFTYTNDGSSFSLGLEGFTYSTARKHYDKLVLYSDSGTSLLEQTPIATQKFIQDEVVGEVLNVFPCSGREAYGPVSEPEPAQRLRLNLGGNLTDPDTGLPPTEATLEFWHYNRAQGRLLFTDFGQNNTNGMRMGEWRWGEDGEGGPYLAILTTRERTGARRTQMQTRPVYNPRYFEDWDLAGLDYDEDGVEDLVDNCSIVFNPAQADWDLDGVGNAWDDDLVPPPYAAATLGSTWGGVEIEWTPAPSGMLYRVYRSIDPGGDSGSAFVPVSGWISGSNFFDTGVGPGEEYAYFVLTANDSATDLSAQSMLVAGWAPLGCVSNVWASDGVYADFTAVTWDEVPGAAVYRVLRREQGKDYAPVSDWINTLRFFDFNGDTGVSYEYAVCPAAGSDGSRTGTLCYTDWGWRYAGTENYDFGDAPETFPVKALQNGARHVLAQGAYLGTTVDAESEGQPSAKADGDDAGGEDDEDGVTFPAEWVAGSPAVIGITPALPGYLNAWADLNDSGTWDTNEHVLVDKAVTAGLNWLAFDLPGNSPAVTGVVTRVRFSTFPGDRQDGVGLDGEVEDHEADGVVSYTALRDVDLDYGDAPKGYPVSWIDEGACHGSSVNGLQLGNTVDREADGAPSPGADHDDSTATDDEDGASWTTAYARGEKNTVTVYAPQGGYLSGWIDFNSDGDWDDDGEKVWASRALTAGANVLSLFVPAEAMPGATAARLRLVSLPVSIDCRGYAPDGEVEDYMIRITQSVPQGSKVWIDSMAPGGAAGVDLGWIGPAGAAYIVEHCSELPAETGDWCRAGSAVTGTALRVDRPTATRYYQVTLPATTP